MSAANYRHSDRFMTSPHTQVFPDQVFTLWPIFEFIFLEFVRDHRDTFERTAGLYSNGAPLKTYSISKAV